MYNPFEEIISRLDKIDEKLAGQPKTEQAKADPERLSRVQALSFLESKGFKVSKSWFDKATANREIPVLRFGRMLLFMKKDLISWAEAKCKPQATRKHDVTANLAKSAKRKTGKP